MANSFLKFDSQALIKDIYHMLSNLSGELINDFYNEATNGMKHKKNTKIELPFAEQNLIISKVLFYANAIMESYGIGSLMDKNSPYLDEYMKSTQWNKLRGNSTTIVGREEGKYENILGKTDYSKGTMVGSSVEDIIKPIMGTYTIQNAERWFLKNNGKIQKQIEMSIAFFFNSNKIKKYFKYTR